MDDTRQHSQWGKVDVCMCADLLGNTMRKAWRCYLAQQHLEEDTDGPFNHSPASLLHVGWPHQFWFCWNQPGKRGEEKQNSVYPLKFYWTPSGSSSNASYWVKASWNFPFHQNEPSLLLCSQNHWLDLNKIIEVWSHDLVLITVFPTTECSLEDRDVSFIFLFWNGTWWFLWQTFTSVKLSWIPAICTVTSSVTLGRLLNILGPQLSALRAGGSKEHCWRAQFHY